MATISPSMGIRNDIGSRSRRTSVRTSHPVGIKKNFEFLDFTGGVNNTQEDDQIEENELSDARNYAPEFAGSKMLRKIPGKTLETAGFAAQPEFIFEGQHANYVQTATTLEIFDGTDVTTGLTSSTTCDAATFNGGDLFVNGTEFRVSTNGTSSSAVSGSPPAANLIETHNNFLFVAGHSLASLRWSSLGIYTSWSTTNELLLGTGENDNITALKKFRDVLMVFTKNRFFHVNGFSVTDMGVVHAEHKGPGCTSHRSVVVNPYGVFWWSDQGLCVSRDGFNVDLPMQRKLGLTLSGLNHADYGEVCGVWDSDNDRIFYCMPNGSATTNDLGFYYYYLQDAFYLCDATVTNRCLARLANGKIYAGNYARDLHELTGERDHDGSSAASITAYGETKRFTPISVIGDYRTRDITLKTRVPTSGNITFGAYVNDETSIDSSNSFTVAAVTTQREYPIGWRRKLNKVKFRFGDALATRPRIQGCVLRGYLLND